MTTKKYIKDLNAFKIGFSIGFFPFLILIILEFIKFNQILSLEGGIVQAIIFGITSGFLMDNLKSIYSKNKKKLEHLLYLFYYYM